MKKLVIFLFVIFILIGLAGNVKADCFNSAQDDDETGTDCGGSCPNTCFFTFYVSPSGLGNHNGSLGNDFNLSQAQNYAVTHTNDSMTFLLSGGNYGAFSTYNSPERNGKWVNWKAISPLTAIFDIMEINAEGLGIYYSFDGITVDSSTNSALTSVLFNSASHIHVYNSFVKGDRKDNVTGTNMYGINVKSDFAGSWPVYDIVLENNEIFNTGGGINTGGDIREGMIFRNNSIHGHTGPGIQAGSSASNFLFIIEGNHIYGVIPVTGAHQSCIAIRGCIDNFLIKNNIIHDCGNTAGIAYYRDDYSNNCINGSYDNMTLEGNLVYDTQNMVPVSLDSLGENITIRRNTFIGFYKGLPGWTDYFRYNGGLKIKTATNYNGSEIILDKNIIIGMFGSDNETRDNLIDLGNIVWTVSNPEWTWSPQINYQNKSIVIISNSGFADDTDVHYFEGSGNFFVGGSQFDKYSFNRTPMGQEYNPPHHINLNNAYYPVLNSDACSGGRNLFNLTNDEYVGALPCVPPFPISCSDGFKDGDETGTDCGGGCPKECNLLGNCTITKAYWRVM
ncbi:hypothetical protein J4402_01770 [Candidatus Pacearchaeota archaeon]|nr:hypothetical protein [Candidatus Pacearchaeota archaeon]